MDKIVFTDIDGTIFHPKKHYISELTYKTLEELRDNGCMIFLNSSRSYEEIRELPDRLFTLVDGIISCAGSVLQIGAETEAVIIPNGREIIENLDYNGINYRYVTAGNQSFLNRPDKFIQDLYREIYGHELKIREYQGEDLVHIHYFPEGNDVEYENRYPELFRYCKYILTSRSHECFSNETDKGLIVRKISERYGIEDTYGIGDGNSDLAMIRMCRFGIAMGNGKQTVKESADYITDTMENEGFCKAMEHYGLTGGKDV